MHNWQSAAKFKNKIKKNIYLRRRNSIKIQTKDDKGYPLNFDPSSFYQLPEQYFPIPQSLYNTNPEIYMVTTWGRVYNTVSKQFVPRKLMLEKNDYVHIILRNIDNQEVSIRMHQLVCRMFILCKPTDQVYYVNHKDGVKWHNEPYNLEWATPSENTIHADENNLISRAHGQDNGSAKLTDAQYQEICELTMQGYLPNQINNIMNTGFDITNIVQKIRSGKSANFIADKYDFSNIPKNDYRKFT